MIRSTSLLFFSGMLLIASAIPLFSDEESGRYKRGGYGRPSQNSYGRPSYGQSPPYAAGGYPDGNNQGGFFGGNGAFSGGNGNTGFIDPSLLNGGVSFDGVDVAAGNGASITSGHRVKRGGYGRPTNYGQSTYGRPPYNNGGFDQAQQGGFSGNNQGGFFGDSSVGTGASFPGGMGGQQNPTAGGNGGQQNGAFPTAGGIGSQFPTAGGNGQGSGTTDFGFDATNVGAGASAANVPQTPASGVAFLKRGGH